MQATTDTSGTAGFFWLAFEKSANAMLLLEDDRTITAANDAAVNMYGYDRADMIGYASDRFIAPQSWRRVEADWRILRREGEVTGSRELIRSDGRRVDVQFAARQELITGRKLVLYVVVDQQLRPIIRASCDPSLVTPTPREMEVITRIAMGCRVHEIATDLFISPSTVQTHVRNAMTKLGTRSQAQLVARAIATGLLDPTAAHPPSAKHRAAAAVA